MRQRKLVRGHDREPFKNQRGGSKLSRALPPTGGSGNGPPPAPPGPPDDGGGKWRVVRIERPVPEESRTWLEVGLLTLTVSAAVALVALTLAEDVKVHASELWTISVGCVALAVTCLLAHWDANRGRKEKRSELTEEKFEDLGP